MFKNFSYSRKHKIFNLVKCEKELQESYMKAPKLRACWSRY